MPWRKDLPVAPFRPDRPSRHRTTCRVGLDRCTVGRIGSEWQFEKGVRPDLAVYVARGRVRLFVGNKCRASLTDR